MKKRFSLNDLKVKSFVTDVKKEVVKGGSDEETFRLECTFQHCSNGSCPTGYCPPEEEGGGTTVVCAP